MNIAIEKIFSIAFKAEQVKSAAARRSNRDLWLPDTEVIIASTGKHMLEERMSVAAELWAKTLRAEYLYPERMTPDELAAEAQAAGSYLSIYLSCSQVAGAFVGFDAVTQGLRGLLCCATAVCRAEQCA